MFVKPLVPVRDPITKQHLPAEGKEVPEVTYWLRRLREGSVVLALAPAPAPVIPVEQITDYKPVARSKS